MLAESKALTPMGDAHPALARLVQARGILAETKSIDVCKTIRDEAEAVRVYMRQKELGQQAEQYAAEIRVRAEYRMGILLAEMPKAPGQRSDLLSQTRGPASPSRAAVLRDAGIRQDRANEYERLARLKEEALDAGIRAAADKGEAVTTKGLLRMVAAQDAAPTETSPGVEVLTRPDKPWVEPVTEPPLPYTCGGCGTEVLLHVLHVGNKHVLRYTPAEKDGQDWYPDDDEGGA